MSDSIVQDLPVPPEAARLGGKEVLRAFIVEGELHVMIDDAFEQPAIWGVMLADIGRHAANLFRDAPGFSPGQALAAIRRGLDEEWSNPTDDPDAQFSHRG